MNQNPALPGLSRSAGGAKARSAGKSFEQLIIASQNDGRGPVCVLEQIHNYAKRIMVTRNVSHAESTGWRTDKEMKLVESKSPFDFAGCVFNKGIAIFIDAKSCGMDAASFRVNDPKICKPHQLRSLAALDRAGAFSGFLIRCERANDYRWLWGTMAAQNCTAPIRWDSMLWEVLGPIEAGRGVPLRKLFDSYR